MGQNTTIMKVFRFSLFACFFLSVFFLANPRVLFSGENLSQDNSFDSADESDQVESLSQTHPFKPVNEKKDPFKPLIRRPDRQERIHFEPIVASEPIIQPPPAPPIKLVVQGICGNSNDRLAMVIFENKFMVLSKGNEVSGKFKVVEVLPNTLVVYSNLEKRRRLFLVEEK